MNSLAPLLPTRRAALLALAVSAVPAMATIGTWNTDAAGNWTTAASWTGGIPDAAGDTANLTHDITASRAISLTGNKTVGTLNIGDSATAGVAPAGFNAFTITSGTTPTAQLIFDQTGSADAILTVPEVAGVAANSLSAYGVLLNDNLVVTTAFPNSATTQLNIQALISDGSGSHGIRKEGQGIIQLAGPNTYKGGTVINGGRINGNHLTAFGSGPVTVNSGGQAYLNTASAYNNFTLAGTGYANTTDTAAQAGALRLENNRVVMGNVAVAAGGARLGMNTTASGFIAGDLSGTGDLEINGPTTTTGTVSLLGSATAYSGTLGLARGNFNFSGGFGGSITVAPVPGATTTLGTGTAVAGSVSLDSTNAPVTIRNLKGTLAISGNLNLAGNSPVSPVSFPAPGTGTLTLMTYAAATGTGSLTFDATNYRGTPALSVGATEAVISGLNGETRTWNSEGGAWDIGTSANWAGGDNKFYNADAVVFGNTAFGTVNLNGTLTPHSVTFNSTGTNDYTLSGTGTIDGAAGGIIKNGDAWLTLGGENTFTGPVSVNGGRLVLGSQRALGLTSGVTVASGATLDMNGKGLFAVSRSIDVTLSGPGDGDLPALTNNGAAITFTGGPVSGIRNVTLAADATVGGPVGRTFDIGGNGVIDGNGFTLTKQGDNQVYLVGISKNLKTVVEGGILSGFGPDPFGGTLTIKNGGTAQAAGSGTYSSDVTIETGGTLQHGVGTDSRWTGTITVPGDAELSNTNASSSSLTLAQGFAVPGTLTKSGGGTVMLLGDVAVAGSVNITSGPLVLGDGGMTGGVGSTAPIEFGSGFFPGLTINRGNSLDLPNPISGAGSISQTGTGTTTLGADNSYSGTTSITGGTLIVNGTHSGTGNVSVASGATLGGSGTLPGDVTVNAGGTLAPGGSTGTIHLGSAGKVVTINGTLRVEYDGTSTDVVAAADALTLGAASIIDFDATGPALTAPAYVIATYATLSGTFGTVTDLPAGYSLTYNHDNGVTATNIALVKTATSFATWIDGFYPGISDTDIVGPNADPDHDGQSNAVEFVLGGTPDSGDSRARIYSVIADSEDEDTGKELLLTIAVRSGTPAFAGSPSPAATYDGFTATVTGSLDLTGFAAPVSVVAPVTDGLPDAPAGYEYRTFSLDASNGLPSKGFLRVEVTP